MGNSTCLDRKKHRRTTFWLVDCHEFEATVVSGRRHEAGMFGCRSSTLVPKPLLFMSCNILACSEVKSVLSSCDGAQTLLRYESRREGFLALHSFVKV
jgi:hypothetical protein